MKRLKIILFFISSVSFFWHCTAQIITTIAGNGVASCSGNGGPATAAELSSQYGIAFDNSGNYYFSNEDSTVRRVSPLGIIYAFAGHGVSGYSGDGGPATAAELGGPWGITVDKSGNVYIADVGNNVIRKVNSSGIISTFAGNGYGAGLGGGGYSGDGGPATAAELYVPSAVATDNLGNVYIADGDNCSIRKVNTLGIISTFAGCGVQGYYGDGGPATAAEFTRLFGVSIDDSGNVLIPDYVDCRIRMVNTSGIVNTIAGNGNLGYSGDGGPATAAELGYPIGVVRDKYGNIYISSPADPRVRCINTSGIINDFAGDSISGYFGDGGPATTAEIYGTNALAVDTMGNVYIPDGPRIRKVTVTLSVLANILSNPNCNGESNGSASVMPYEAPSKFPYIYSWTPRGGSNSTATGLSAGTYTITVTDSIGSTDSAFVIITQPAAITMAADSINVTGTCNGSAWVIVGGGTPSYSYLWTGGLTTDTITNQCIGDYCCTITDAHGCIDSVCTTIESATGTSEVKGESEKVKVYPNPNNGLFTIALSSHAELVSASQTKVEIFNVFGEKVFTETLQPQTPKGALNSIDMSGQPCGMYLYRVITENGDLIGEGKIIIVK